MDPQARPKQETGKGPEGDLCLEQESRLSPCVCLKTKKGGVCVCVCVQMCEAVPFKTV